MVFLLVYVLWATGPITVDPENGFLTVAQLLVLTSVLDNIGNLLVDFIRQLTDLYTSGSMVIEVARLL